MVSTKASISRALVCLKANVANVRTFMVHHQAWRLAFDNVLHGNIMQDRCTNPRKVAAPLLYRKRATFWFSITNRRTPHQATHLHGFVTDEFSSADIMTPASTRSATVVKVLI